MLDDKNRTSKEALLVLSRYLPAPHRSKEADNVFLSVDSAFRTLECQLAGSQTQAACLLGALIRISKMEDPEKIREFAAQQVRDATNGKE